MICNSLTQNNKPENKYEMSNNEIKHALVSFKDICVDMFTVYKDVKGNCKSNHLFKLYVLMSKQGLI